MINSFFVAFILLAFILLCNANTIPETVETEENEERSFDKRACKPLYTQCEGKNYFGPKCCQAGYCKRLNDWYYYCSE